MVKEDNFWKDEISTYRTFLDKKPGAIYEDFDPMKSYVFWRLAKYFLKKVKSENFKVLEPGCGTGLCLCYLANYGANCVGVDYSDYAIKRAKNIINEKGLSKKVKILKKDMYHLPFKDNSFDLVFNCGVIEHLSLKKQENLLKEMVRCSKKYVCVLIPNPKSPMHHILEKLWKKTKKNYNVPEKRIDLRKLFKKFKLQNIETDGYGMFTSGKSIDKKFRSLIQMYQRAKKYILDKDKEKLKGFPFRNYNREHFKIFAELEDRMPSKDRLTFSYLTSIIGEKC
jgi:ubiquinone/menaquinone biosynthesis C-methylase UbiE